MPSPQHTFAAPTTHRPGGGEQRRPVGPRGRRRVLWLLAMVAFTAATVVGAERPGPGTVWERAVQQTPAGLVPYRSIPVAGDVSRVAVDEDGFVLVAAGPQVDVYDRDGVYYGRLDVDGEQVSAVFAQGGRWFVAAGDGFRAYHLHQYGPNGAARVTYPLHAAAFSAASAVGDDALVWFEGGGGLARLRPSTGVIDRWASGADPNRSDITAPIFVSADGHRAIVDRLDAAPSECPQAGRVKQWIWQSCSPPYERKQVSHNPLESGLVVLPISTAV